MSRESDAITAATQAVQEAGLDLESAVGIAAFQEILRQRLGIAHGPVRDSVKLSDNGTSESDAPQDESPAGRAANWLGVSVESLHDIASFGPDGVDLVIHASQLPDKKRARQRLIGLLKIGLDRVAYDRVDVPAREVNAICADYACMDQNLPTALTNYENFITRRGDRGAATYRISQYGVEECRQILRSFVDAS